MSTDRQQDAGLDRLLRATLQLDAPASGEVCPEAGVVAAYAEGGLTARERIGLEPHLAACARCQAVLAVMARDASAEATGPARADTWRTWFSVPRLRWLVPASVAAIAIVLYVAVKPETPGLGEPVPAASAAPEFTVAQQLNKVVPTEHLRQPPSTTERSSPLPESLPSPAAQEHAAVRAMPDALQPPVTTGIQARAEVAVAPQAPAAKPAATGAPAGVSFPAGAAGRTNLDLSGLNRDSQKSETVKSVISHGSGPMTGVDLDTLWTLSDLIVLARAGSTGKPFLPETPVDRPVTTTVEPIVPTGFDIVEVLKRKNTVPPNPHLTLWQLGGEAEDEQAIRRVPDDGWVRIQPGEACVLFLVLSDDAAQPDGFEPVSGPNGIYRLDGERVFVGSATLPEKALPTRELLAQLRQRAGTARR